MLMGLIAEEMVNTWQDETNALPEADAPTMSSAGISAEDIFYAQMNGEPIYPLMNSNQSIVSDDDELDDDDIEDGGGGGVFSDSFCYAGLALPEDAYAGLEEEDAIEKSSVRTRRSSVESVSKASRCSRRSSQSIGDDTLSMGQIQRYVREIMPEEVRKKIPQEARGRIFGESLSGDETSKPTNKVEVLEDEEKKEEEDDSSVISDITEYTEFIKSVRSHHHGFR
jgi:hypothetical protein